jgi:hypothetical protein
MENFSHEEKWFEQGGWSELFTSKPNAFEFYRDDDGDLFVKGEWEDGTKDFAGIEE